VLFLSYAEEDRETAGLIADWLRDKGHEVFRWEDPRRRGGRFIRQIEAAINQSDAFLAVLSPSFLTSDWCHRETELGLQREQDLQAVDPDLGFVHVLKILDAPNSDAGFLRSYDWLDLTDPASREVALAELDSRLRQGGKLKSTGFDSSIDSGPVSPMFRNREDELEKVLRGLTNSAGPHFWLVIAPPQLGKTWFLQRVRADVTSSGSVGWMTVLVDLRTERPELRTDVPALLASLFELPSPTALDPKALLIIAQKIIKNGKPYLCLLDSAELLDRQTAATLRSCLSKIYRYVQDGGNNRVRLAFIVGSRREDEWRGVTPEPRLVPLPLTEFNADVVQQALRDLAQEMDRTFTVADFRTNARRVHRLTEGLPALLVRCLLWIRDEEWLGLERLDSQELFEELTDRYIREDLLARESLFPGVQGQGDEPLQALEQTFRILAPYRLFTQSHLRHHLDSDSSFGTVLSGPQWNMEDLWRAISGTALLTRPLNEPWQQIQAAIRRLLHRHYYKSDEQRAEAHCEARKFIEVWADKQPGKEQVIGLVESLWHEATVLRLRKPMEMEQRLSESARTLSRALSESSAYTPDELRNYAAERMRADEELEETVSNVDGLFIRLIEIVATPL
jgi:hypothetical protein